MLMYEVVYVTEGHTVTEGVTEGSSVTSLHFYRIYNLCDPYVLVSLSLYFEIQ